MSACFPLSGVEWDTVPIGFWFYKPWRCGARLQPESSEAKRRGAAGVKSQLSDAYPCGDGCGATSDSAFDLQALESGGGFSVLSRADICADHIWIHI